jgi:hypothetical protein
MPMHGERVYGGLLASSELGLSNFGMQHYYDFSRELQDCCKLMTVTGRANSLGLGPYPRGNPRFNEGILYLDPEMLDIP